MKSYRPFDPRQALLLPPSLLDWLPDGHLARFILDLVPALNLESIYRHYERELRGYPPHHPQMMVGLLLYGYCVGVRSSRKIARKTYEDVAFRVLAGDTHPDHTCISEFRRIHLSSLEELFGQVLRLCKQAGLVKLGQVAIDGTKMKANASKHKAMSYERMKRQEEELRAKVAELLRQAEQEDAEEDARYGKDKRGDELPEELARASTRLDAIRKAKAALEAEAKQAQREQKEEKERQNDDDEPPPGRAAALPHHRVKHDAEGTPKPKAQRNFTDPESRIMKSSDGFMQAWNCQIAVDAKHQIIVAQAVTNQPPDVEHAVPLVDRVIESCGVPEAVLLDAGYFSDENVKEIESRGIEPFIASRRERQSTNERAKPRAASATRQRMEEKLATKEARAVYARRKVIVEPVFGQIKEARGIRGFLMRGTQKVRGEWSLIALTHNLLKLYRVAAVAP